MRGRAVWLALLLCGGAGQTATAQDLCSKLVIPAELDLVCTASPNVPPGGVVIAPASGAFAALSRMTVRALDRSGADDMAWSDPAAWLRRQMTLDTSSYADAMAGLGDDPDSPFSGEAVRTAIDRLRSALAGVATLPLSACGAPVADERHHRWDMQCTYGTGGLGVSVDLRLVAEGERRWELTMRSANEQRLRHFRAIAGTFQPN